MKQIKNYIYVLAAVVILYSCSPADGNFAGSEYMPDMGHSVAYEANVYNYYYYNTWDSASTFRLKDLSNPRLPVDGTVARGYAGVYLNGEQSSDEEVMNTLRGEDNVNAIAVPVNGNVPYYYEDTEEERTRATAELLDNPFPITAEGLAKGKELYDIFCGICHGEKGDGYGYLVREADPAKGDPGGKYPVVPANLLLPDYANSSNGRYYHAIIYGKNAMGGYADKMNYEERWQIIHYIRALQAKDQSLEYDETTNTLNPEFGTPVSEIAPMASNEEMTEAVAPEMEGDHSSDEDHGEGH
jgi:mono/diheme cytochrome c family protein